jgi:hypothetical protein
MAPRRSPSVEKFEGYEVVPIKYLPNTRMNKINECRHNSPIRTYLCNEASGIDASNAITCMGGHIGS